MNKNFTPIKSNEEFKPIGLLGKKPVVEPNTVKIFIGEGDKSFVCREGTVLTRGELNSRHYVRVYDIDIKPQSFEIEFQADSIDPLEKFKVKVDVTISIEDSVQIIRNAISDLYDTIVMLFKRCVEQMTIACDVENTAEAQAAIDSLIQSKELDFEFRKYGLHLEYIKIRILLSDEYLKKMKSRRDSRSNNNQIIEDEIERKRIELERLKIENELKQERLKRDASLEAHKRILNNELMMTEEAARIRQLEIEETLRRLKFEKVAKLYKEGGLANVQIYYAHNKEELDSITTIFESLRKAEKSDREEYMNYLAILKNMGIDERESMDIINSLNVKIGAPNILALNEDKAKEFLEDTPSGIEDMPMEE